MKSRPSLGKSGRGKRPANAGPATQAPGVKPSRRTFKRRLQKLGTLAGKTFTWMLRTAIWPFQLARQVIFYVLHALNRLRHTPNFKELIRGLPALALLVTAIAFSTYQYFRDANIRSRLALRYSRAAFAALAHQQEKTAVTYFDRAISLEGREDNETVFGLAMALEKANDPMRFTAVAEQIAPLTEARYAPAHVWRARRILDAELTPEVARGGEVHLLHAINLEPTNIEARMMLGRLYFVAGRFDGAVRNLEMAVDKYPEDLLSLAKAHAALGHKPQAIRIAGQAIDYFGKVVAANPYNPNPDPRLRLAESYLFLEQFPQSLQVLRDGLARRNSPELKTATARVYLVWADRLGKEGKFADRLNNLQQAISADPNEKLAFQQIMEVLNQEGADSQSLRKSLLEVLREGKATPLIHLLLGTDAAVHNDTDAATTHLEIAFQSDPQMTIAANNLAWVLAYAEKPDFARSTALIEAVLQKQPDELEFHHTRGMILVQMEKWPEAVIELERVLSTHGDTKTREALAKAYDHLGLKDLAAEQKRLIEAELTPTNSPSQNP